MRVIHVSMNASHEYKAEGKNQFVEECIQDGTNYVHS